MVEYATISVPKEIKSILKAEKGEKEWGTFLLELYEEVRKLKTKSAFTTLVDMLTEDELKEIIKSSKEFRKKFTLLR